MNIKFSKFIRCLDHIILFLLIAILKLSLEFFFLTKSHGSCSIIMHDLLSLLKTGVYKKHLFYISFVRHCFSALKKPPPLRESITGPLNHRLSMRHSNF